MDTVKQFEGYLSELLRTNSKFELEGRGISSSEELKSYIDGYVLPSVQRLNFGLEKIKTRPHQVLDITCFLTTQYLFYYFRGAKFYGCDLRTWWKRYLDPSIVWAETDLSGGKLPYSDHFFDMVVCTSVLEHIPIHPVALFKEMFRVMTNGYLLFSTPNIFRTSNRMRMIFGRNFLSISKDSYGFHGHFREYSLNEIVEIAGQVGFSIEFAGYYNGKHAQSPGIDVIQRGLAHLCPAFSTDVVVLLRKQNGFEPE